MKELNFRAWDHAEEEYRDPRFKGMVYFDIYSVPDFIGQTYIEENSTKFVRRFTVMEYTGFKDQNGNKIYEGDIWESPGGRYVVEFRHFGWFPFVDSYGCLCCEGGSYSPWRGKVIGNKYENPELLRRQ